MKNYTITKITQKDYDEEFASVGNRSYLINEILETTLEKYTSDCVDIPNGKEYISAKPKYKLKGYIAYGQIYKSATKILFGLGTNYALLNRNRPNEWILEWLLHLNKYHTVEYVSYEELNGIYEDIVNDIDQLPPYMPIIKKSWVNPNCPDKIKAYRERFKNQNGLSNNDILLNLPDRKVTINELYKLSSHCSERSFGNALTEEQKAIIKSHNKKYNKR